MDGQILNIIGEKLIENQQEQSDILKRVATKTVSEIQIQLQNITPSDTAFIAWIYRLIKIAEENHIPFMIQNAQQNLSDLLHLALAVDRKPQMPVQEHFPFLEYIGINTLKLYAVFQRGLSFVLKSLSSLFLIRRSLMRKVDLIDALDACGPKALLIVSLISFMVGLILAFVGAIQLKTFGAQIYVASLVTIGMIRIMGAIMVGIIMAGRTGASYAASIGSMQVNEELDALKTMGIAEHDFLVLPRLLALVIAMPILVLLSDVAGMVGGACVGVGLLGIPAQEYIKYAIDSFGLGNFLVGIFHGFVFAFIIAWCGCYYGIYCDRNAQSVGVATTKAVVSAIVWMIVLTGVITLICEVLGI